ncbi:MAG: hypothetical protein HC827_00425 [Cyanobacteria bacterium RM1_2_2]|nr:hypothetical protein [Cyanobacteria bacterium RM1_2_2]
MARLNPLQQLRRSLVMVGLSALLLMSSGCNTLARLNPTFAPRPVDLTILRVEPENSGRYSVSGNTTLPDKTQITVSAVRYFQNGTQATGSSTPERNYAILDRQVAEVTQGNWETRLNLWQSSASGQFQEAWQVKLDSEQRVEPEADVTFLATLEPANQPASLRRQVEALESSQQVAITRFTTDGELYLQAVKTLPVPPPQGVSSAVFKIVNSTQADQPKKAETNANASEAQQVQQQIDMPLSPDAFVR